jgi:hypothetical protein
MPRLTPLLGPPFKPMASWFAKELVLSWHWKSWDRSQVFKISAAFALLYAGYQGDQIILWKNRPNSSQKHIFPNWCITVTAKKSYPHSKAAAVIKKLSKMSNLQEAKFERNQDCGNRGFFPTRVWHFLPGYVDSYPGMTFPTKEFAYFPT